VKGAGDHVSKTGYGQLSPVGCSSGIRLLPNTSSALYELGDTPRTHDASGNALLKGNSEYPLYDGHGSERTDTASNESVTGTINFEAFGQTVGTPGSSSSPYMYAGAWGYRTDGDAGLMHVGARYYDAQVGRFITRDTVLSEHPCLYCEHHPVNWVDPGGQDRTWDSIRHRFVEANAFCTPATKGAWCESTLGGVGGGASCIYAIVHPPETRTGDALVAAGGVATAFAGSGMVTGGATALSSGLLATGAVIGTTLAVVGGAALVGVGVFCVFYFGGRALGLKW